jgi:hypothetical protein
MNRFDRYWLIFLVLVGSYVIMHQISKLYFWVMDHSATSLAKAIDYNYITKDHKVILPTNFKEEVSKEG